MQPKAPQYFQTSVRVISKHILNWGLREGTEQQWEPPKEKGRIKNKTEEKMRIKAENKTKCAGGKWA